MNKRGQVILIAALIAVGAIFSVAAVVNQARANEENKAFYDLSKEIDFESKRVLDYGTYKQENTNTLIESFLNKYANYIKQDKVLFIHGDSTGLKGLIFEQQKVGSVGISGGGEKTNILIEYLGSQEAEVTNNNGKVDVRINDITYPFNLEPGQNFFFVIIKDDGGDQLVSTG